jgi:hypothetical protein
MLQHSLCNMGDEMELVLTFSEQKCYFESQNHEHCSSFLN